jgi:phage regulator Rha-like protein
MADKLTKLQKMIYDIRGQNVMLDSDLADLYGVELEEWANLRSQIVTFSNDSRKYKPYAFTEHGILMLSSVLNSERAININIQVMRIFVRMRHYTISQNATNEQIAELRKLLMLYIEKNDKRVNDIIIILNNLIEQPPKTKKIGFNAEK